MRHHLALPRIPSICWVTHLEPYRSLSDNVQWHQLEDELAKGKKFLDVRTSGEFQNGRLKVDTIHIPLNELRERLDELDKNQAYID